VVSNKKIFKISTNQNTLWALAAMLDKFKMTTMTRLNFNIGPYGKNVSKSFPLKLVSQFKANMA
jgi:hypothetical protein